MVARVSASTKGVPRWPSAAARPRPGDHPAMLAFGFTPDSR